MNCMFGGSPSEALFLTIYHRGVRIINNDAVYN